MADLRIAPQVEFNSLYAFVEGSNNFQLHFFPNSSHGTVYRNRSVFLRFQKANPNMEKEISEAVPNPKEEFPWRKLFEAYKLMSQLVFVDDPAVMRDGQPDRYYLVR